MAKDSMLEAHVCENTNVTIHRVPIPELPRPTSILIKVHVASTNPKDWKMPTGMLKTIGDCPNSGDDCAGTDFQVGQRVIALHQLGAPYGVFAEYCIVEDFACIPIPDDLPFEAAATLPMAYFVAVIGLYAPSSLALAEGPWDARKPGHPLENEPLLVYGASTAVGTMAIKLARICNIHPIIAIAGRAKDWVAEELLDASKGDVVFDYRDGHDALVENLKSALKGKRARYAFDPATDKGSYLTLAEVLEPDGKIVLTLPGKATQELKQAQNGKFAGLQVSHAMAGSLWKALGARPGQEDTGKDKINLGLTGSEGPTFGRKMSASLAQLLKDGRIQPRKYEVREGGLRGLDGALKDLRAGKNSAMSYVVRVSETEGIDS
ncbi:Enoyl LovC [Cyphellophora attinorum]|uniref:Enoyl LovC n=1 Tax=Cyphellophora attinorum TaxID=1664694 RepID=A0A0N1HST5_9EURO|nr:Enoyl LovC [Phialophora attinorum]KPI41785.1 Enoyl LovC [Phialophora attinorum]